MWLNVRLGPRTLRFILSHENSQDKFGAATQLNPLKGNVTYTLLKICIGNNTVLTQMWTKIYKTFLESFLI